MTRSNIPLLFLAGWTAIAIVTLYYVLTDLFFALDSSTTVGTVAWKHEHVHYPRRTLHLVHYSTYFAGYTYSVSGVGQQSGSAQVEASTYALLDQGGSVPIRYLSGNSTLSRIDLPAENQFFSLITIGWIAVSVVGAFGLRIVWREYLRGG